MNPVHSPFELALVIRKTLSVAPDCHVSHEILRVCWRITVERDSHWRKREISAFAEENGWECEQDIHATRFCLAQPKK